jgi:hypothetical protein
MPEPSTADRPLDLSDDELARINDRIGRALGRYDALPYHSLLYRLGEVGSRRVEEKALRRALAELANNRRPRRGRVGNSGPWETFPRLYVRGDATRDEALSRAQTARAALSELVSYSPSSIVDELAAQVAIALSARDASRPPPPAKTVTLGAGIDLLAEARLVDVVRPNAPAAVRILVLHEPGWIYPDDKRFWRFLFGCHQDGIRAVLLARAIAPGMFPLFKALNVVGVQYYSTLVIEKSAKRAADLRERIGWSHIRPVTSAAAHVVMERLGEVIDRLSHEPTPDIVRNALARIETTSLTSTPTIKAIVDWCRRSGLPLPAPVVRGWGRWQFWDAYRRNGGRAARPSIVDLEAQADAPPQDTEPLNESGREEGQTRDAETTTGFGRETQVIPMGLPLPRREVEAILANAKRPLRVRRQSDG